MTFAYLFIICLALQGIYLCLFPSWGKKDPLFKRRLLSEVVSEIKKTKSRRKKIKFLMANMCPGLEAILRLNFDRKIILDIDLDIKYLERLLNDSIDSINHSSKTWNSLLVTGNQPRKRKTLKFKSILESLDPKEAELLFSAAKRELNLGITWFTIKRCFPKNFLGRL